MRSWFLVIALCASAAACGRGELDELGSGGVGEDAGSGDAIIIGGGDAFPRDFGPGPGVDAGMLDGGRRDAMPMMPDSGPRRDGGPRPDSGPQRDGGRDAGRDGGRDAGPPRPDVGPLPDSGISSPVGDPCMNAPGECGNAGFCIDENQGFPDGYCSEPCPNGLMCPGDSVCREVGGGNEICLDGCVDANDCRGGYQCVLLGIGSDRVCWPTPPMSMNPLGNAIGEDCMADDDCDQGYTCIDLPGAAPGGYCTVLYCDPMTNACPSASECYAFPGLFSLCLAECPNAGTQSTCRNGYYCLGPTGQDGVCINM